MNMGQARRIIAGYTATMLFTTEAFGFADLSEADKERLARAADDLCGEMQRRARREDLSASSLADLIAAELGEQRNYREDGEFNERYAAHFGAL